MTGIRSGHQVHVPGPAEKGHMLGHGVYTPTEAARLGRVTPQRISRWFFGYGASLAPVVPSDYWRSRGERLLSFLDLIDAVVMGRLREKGLSLQYLRKVHDRLMEALTRRHPFSCKNLFTDGKKVFVHVADEMGEEEQLQEALSGQHAFPEILLPYLSRVDYDADTLLARRWHVAEGVLIDPERRFGKPVLAESTIPTSIIAAAYNANARNAEAVADWYGVTEEEVKQAIRFEEYLHGKAA